MSARGRGASLAWPCMGPSRPRQRRLCGDELEGAYVADGSTPISRFADLSAGQRSVKVSRQSPDARGNPMLDQPLTLAVGGYATAHFYLIRSLVQHQS